MKTNDQLIHCAPYNCKILPTTCEKRLRLLTHSGKHMMFVDSAMECLKCARGLLVIDLHKLKIKDTKTHTCSVCKRTTNTGARFNNNPRHRFNMAHTCVDCSKDKLIETRDNNYINEREGD